MRRSSGRALGLRPRPQALIVCNTGLLRAKQRSDHLDFSSVGHRFQVFPAHAVPTLVAPLSHQIVDIVEPVEGPVFRIEWIAATHYASEIFEVLLV
jgi:hypothetical protein